MNQFLVGCLRRQFTVLPVSGIQARPTEAGIFRTSWPTLPETERPSGTTNRQPSLMDLYRQIEEQT